MKITTKYILASIALLALIIACTKEVGLYTEVEFEITEEHEVDGFINNPLATFLTVTPEELLEDLSYSFSYKINSGAGYFEAVDGTIIQEGEKVSFNPLSASLDYIPTSIGDHSVTFTASDTFGFTEEITLTYTITNIPVTWTAEGPTGPVLLGSSQSITVTLGNEAAITGATYQRNYSFSEGSGNLYTAAPESNTIAVNDFVSIAPGTYQLEYISNELGVTTIEFLLRDSNEQELIATVSFEVVDKLSTEKEITSFIVNGIAGTITGTTIDVVLPEGTDLTALAPIIIHTGASISPESEINQDFSNPVIYTVTAQDETIQAYTVNCSSNISVASVAIAPNPVTINIGETENLSAATTPTNATNQNVTWSSSDDAIASVSATGIVTGNAIGTATITVTTEDGGFTATSAITVQAATFAVTGITVDPTAITITNGSTTTLNETIAPANATNQNVTWSSSDDAIASVSATGVVTGNAIGTATITVTSEDGDFTATSTITVQAATFAVTGITVDPTAITITNGSTTTLNETIAPANATNQNVTWSSSDDAIASVSATGVVTGNAIGTATITVATEDGGFTATSTITVQAATFAVTGITVDPTAITITNGSTTTLNETIAPANATNQNVTWSSSDDAIASVSATGVVTGNAIGTATITVTTEDGGFTATSTITVQAATFAVTGITVDPTAITITNGSTTTLNETIAPANATNQNVTWSSDNTSVATVNTSGLVTSVGVGEAKITVTTEDGGFTATSAITVQTATFAVTGITVDPTAITITNGSTTTLTETIAPANATNQNVTWSSDNTSVATVNASGLVTSVGVGEAKITVTTEDGGFTATSLVTVEAAAIAVTSVSISPTSITITNGSTTTLTGTIAPANATNQNVTWSSDNTSVATVNTSGVVTSVGVGEAKITVTTQDGGFTATSLVTVEDDSIAVTSVSISPTAITITNGSTTTLTGTIAPTNATNQNVTWSSSNTSLATVNATGLVTGVGVGSAIITITTEDGNFFANSLITVNTPPIPVTSVSVDPLSIMITEGNTTMLNEIILPANATDKDVTWSSDDITVAIVDASGVVTGVGVGTAIITVTTDDGNKTATSNITVEAITVTLPNVTVGINQIITLPTNSVTLTGSATDSDGIATYTWTKISGGGSTIVTPTAASTLVTGLLEGTYIFRLTATDNLGSENFAEVEVIVNPAPITLPTVNAGSNQTITLPTNSVMLAGSATDADGISTYAWTKINGGIATIVTPSDASTSITSLVAGAYIFRLTATDNLGSENFAEVEVIVNPAPITLPTVNAGSNQTITLPTNSVMLVGSATDADGISTYAWTKISGGIATIVTPSAESTSITGLIAGTYTFRLTATDNLGSQNFAEVDVIVKPQPAPSVTFDPTTGVYTAPAGSTVTVNLTTQGVGKGNAWVNIVEISSNINTSWNGLEDEMFLESDTDSFIMPASGVVTFEGNHFDTFNLSFGSSSVEIFNNQGGPAIGFNMDRNIAMPQ